jgi:hypothetical protein
MALPPSSGSSTVAGRVATTHRGADVPPGRI